uniref:Uncharacterized protein n=1 Tax=Sinorhizobium saheli TaxID=36856 RepID=D1CTH8_SINSA|nr:hypothetical protein [Sinorhizobium saheli]
MTPRLLVIACVNNFPKRLGCASAVRENALYLGGNSAIVPRDFRNAREDGYLAVLVHHRSDNEILEPLEVTGQRSTIIKRLEDIAVSIPRTKSGRVSRTASTALENPLPSPVKPF